MKHQVRLSPGKPWQLCGNYKKSDAQLIYCLTKWFPPAISTWRQQIRDVLWELEPRVVVLVLPNHGVVPANFQQVTTSHLYDEKGCQCRVKCWIAFIPLPRVVKLKCYIGLVQMEMRPSPKTTEYFAHPLLIELAPSFLQVHISDRPY